MVSELSALRPLGQQQHCPKHETNRARVDIVIPPALIPAASLAPTQGSHAARRFQAGRCLASAHIQLEHVRRTTISPLTESATFPGAQTAVHRLDRQQNSYRSVTRRGGPVS